MRSFVTTVTPEVRDALRASAEQLAGVKRDAVEHATAVVDVLGVDGELMRHRAELEAIIALAAALTTPTVAPALAVAARTPISGDRALIAELAHGALIALLEDELEQLLEAAPSSTDEARRLSRALGIAGGLVRVLEHALSSR